MSTVLQIRFFGSCLSGYVFWIRFLRLRFSGYGFSDTVGWGGTMWILHHKIPPDSPDNRIRKTVCLGLRFLRLRFSGYGFSDTVVWGGTMWILHHKIPPDSPDNRIRKTVCLGLRIGILWCNNHILPPSQPCPKNRIPKTGAEETVSKKPYPESQDPKNRIRKTVSTKQGPKQPDPKRVRLGRMWLLRIRLLGMVFETV